MKLTTIEAKSAGGLLLILTAAIFPPFSLYGAKIVIWLILALLILGAHQISRHKIRTFSQTYAPVFLCALGICLWGVVTAIWSLDPSRSFTKALALAAQFLGVAVFCIAYFDKDADLHSGRAEQHAKFILIGFAAALAILVFELFNGGVLVSLIKADSGNREKLFSQYNLGLVNMALISWSAMAALYLKRRTWAVTLIPGATAALIWLFHGTAISIAAIIGCVSFLVVFYLPKLGPRLIITVSVIAILAAPFIAAPVLGKLEPRKLALEVGNVSVMHRLIVWEFSAKKILEKPFQGWGFEASRLVPGGKEDVRLLDPGRHPRNPWRYGTVMPNYPHNAPLQFWLELGLPGAALAAAFIFLLVRTLERRFKKPFVRACVFAQLTVILTILCFSFSVWQSWLYACLTLLIVISAPIYTKLEDSKLAGNLIPGGPYQQPAGIRRSN